MSYTAGSYDLLAQVSGHCMPHVIVECVVDEEEGRRRAVGRRLWEIGCDEVSTVEPC